MLLCERDDVYASTVIPMTKMYVVASLSDYDTASATSTSLTGATIVGRTTVASGY